MTKLILVVEDEPSIAEFCHTVLTREGFAVDVKFDGKEAQRAAAKQKYDLLFIDIEMSEMTGREFYEWLLIEHTEMANRALFTTGSVIGGDTLSFI